MSVTSQTSFRLSTEARRLLLELATRDGVSMTAVLEMLIRSQARKVNKGRKVKR